MQVKKVRNFFSTGFHRWKKKQSKKKKKVLHLRASTRKSDTLCLKRWETWKRWTVYFSKKTSKIQKPFPGGHVSGTLTLTDGRWLGKTRANWTDVQDEQTSTFIQHRENRTNSRFILQTWYFYLAELFTSNTTVQEGWTRFQDGIFSPDKATEVPRIWAEASHASLDPHIRHHSAYKDAI